MKRRVLHLRTVCGKGGGPEKTLLTTPRFLGSDYDVRLAYLRPACDPDYDMPERAREAGATLVDIPEHGPLDPRSMLRLTREIRRFRPQVLHAHDYKTNVLSVTLGTLFGIPAITTMHGYGLGGGRLRWYFRIDRWALRKMAAVIAVSPDLDELAAKIGVPESRRFVIENAIDTDSYRRQGDRKEYKVQFGLPPDRLWVGAVGRLHPEKGFDVLVEATRRLLARGFNLELAVAGEGPDRARLERLIEESGGSSRIRLLGYCDRPRDLFHAMDLFVLSSLREALPNVLLEAMAMELPVVATRVAGVPRLITDLENGRLVPPADPAALEHAMADLLMDQAARARLGVAARATIEQRYSFTERMRKVRGVYDRVLA